MAEKSRAEILGENLARIRKEKGFSRKQLADVVGMTEIAFGLYERGGSTPSLEKIFMLADFLQVSVSSLTGENNFADSIPDVEKIIDEKIFEYRLQKAWQLTEYLEPDFNAGGFLGSDEPMHDENGRITLYSAEKVIYENGCVSSVGNSIRIAFENEKDFIKVMEQSERNALYKQIPLSESFRDIVFGMSESFQDIVIGKSK